MHRADLDLVPTTTDDLGPTDNLFQSPLWARFRMRIGTAVEVVDLGSGSEDARMVVQLEQQGDFRLAYVAAGPDVDVADDEQGLFLEELSGQLRPHLPSQPMAVRYDLPWRSPYDGRDGRPSARAREIRMNFGTHNHRLHKAPTDRLAPDTVEIDLGQDEERLLAAMRSKTRYNVRLAGRRGVTVRRGDASLLPAWHDLYVQTAARKGFRPSDLGYFRSLFDLAADHRAEIRLYLAYGGPAQGRGNGRTSHGPGLLGGIIVAHVGRIATYLYGASSERHRSLMAPHALQWHAICEARRSGCLTYDLFGVPPAPDEGHPMYGLYRFKTGFGGRIVHRRGAWDYVYDPEMYGLFGAAEATSRGYYR
jgi:lipid II:glycine glycyltransferase (peptidoglycan interpeptide bridge formation enzyme)